MEFKTFKGTEIEAIFDALAELRIQVFGEFPYLYQGSKEFEFQYLNKYVNSDCSFLYTIWNNQKLIGASSCIALSDEFEDVKDPFIKADLDINSIIYFGESILLKEYRNQGFGKLFMEKRVEFASSFPWCKAVYFCSVERPENHPLKPVDYKNLHTFWRNQGFTPTELSSVFVWKDKNETLESEKKMNFWMKSIQLVEAL